MVPQKSFGQNGTKSKPIAARAARSYGLLANLFVLVLIAAAGIANLLVSNNITSQRFALEVKKRELHTIGNNLAAQEVALSSTAGMAQMLALVQQRGMVPGTQGQTMFLNSGVAYINESAQDQN